MNATEYRKLCRRIYKRYRKSHDLLFIDACELADLVTSGRVSEDRLASYMAADRCERLLAEM